jgi:hypothetical protein
MSNFCAELYPSFKYFLTKTFRNLVLFHLQVTGLMTKAYSVDPTGRASLRPCAYHLKTEEEPNVEMLQFKALRRWLQSKGIIIHDVPHHRLKL